MFGLWLEMLRAVEDAVRMGADPADFGWRSFGRHRRGRGGNGRTCGMGSGAPEHRRGARCEGNGIGFLRFPHLVNAAMRHQTPHRMLFT